MNYNENSFTSEYVGKTHEELLQIAKQQLIDRVNYLKFLLTLPGNSQKNIDEMSRNFERTLIHIDEAVIGDIVNTADQIKYQVQYLNSVWPNRNMNYDEAFKRFMANIQQYFIKFGDLGKEICNKIAGMPNFDPEIARKEYGELFGLRLLSTKEREEYLNMINKKRDENNNLTEQAVIELANFKSQQGELSRYGILYKTKEEFYNSYLRTQNNMRKNEDKPKTM